MNIQAIREMTPCSKVCEPRPMMGRSWWKCLGYNTPCLCAVQQQLIEDDKERKRLEKENEMLINELREAQRELNQMREDRVIIRAEDKTDNGEWEGKTTEGKLLDIKKWCDEFNVDFESDIIAKCLRQFSCSADVQEDGSIIWNDETERIYWDDDKENWVCEKI
jgi:hypothetical protein